MSESRIQYSNDDDKGILLEYYKTVFTADKLVFLKKDLDEYIKLNGTTEPTDYSLVNWALSFAGGYIRTNQPYAKKALDCVTRAIDAMEKNEYKTAVYVLTALEELKAIHNLMIRDGRTGTIKNKIEAIIIGYDLSLDQKEFEKKIEIISHTTKYINTKQHMPGM